MQGSKRSIILRGPTQTSALQQSQSLHPGHPLCTPAWPPDVAPARPSSAPPTPWRAPRRRAGASGRAAGRGGRRRRPGSGRRVEKGFAIRRVPSWVDSWQSTQMLMLESWRVFQMLGWCHPDPGISCSETSAGHTNCLTPIRMAMTPTASMAMKNNGLQLKSVKQKEDKGASPRVVARVLHASLQLQVAV